MTVTSEDESGKVDCDYRETDEGRMMFRSKDEGTLDETLGTPGSNSCDFFSIQHSEEHRLEKFNKIWQAFRAGGEEPYQSMVALAKDIFGVPICLLSLVYKDFSWSKAGVGLASPKTPRRESFCAHTLIPERPEVLYIPDTLKDERFKDNAQVLGPPYIRFYIGCPLVTADNVRLGTLCLIDRVPRKMRREDMRILINFSEVVVRELLRTETAQKFCGVGGSIPAAMPSKRTWSGKRLPSMSLLRAEREPWFQMGLVEGVLLVDINSPEWRVRWTNSCWAEWTRNSGTRQVMVAPLMSVLRPCDMVGSNCELQTEILRQVREDASGQASFMAVVIRDGVVCDKRFSVRATLADRSAITAGASCVDLPSQDIIPSAVAKDIDLGGASYLMLQVTPAPCDPDSGKHAAASRAALLSVEVPQALPTLLQANNASDIDTGTSKDAAVSASLLPVDVSNVARGVVEAFVRHDREGTGDLPVERLIAICSRLHDHLDGDTIETFLDSSGLVINGRIDYNDFVAWLFAGVADGEGLSGSIQHGPTL